MYKPLFLKREVLVFHCFQRKGYSLFACLGREVVISVLSVATLQASKAAGISDEVWRVDSTGHVREVMLRDVGVTGSRAPLATSQAARMVTVLSREDIAQAPVQSVNDLLKYAVGVDVRQRGALGAQTDVSIRGGTQEQITILLNGVNIGDPQTGHNALDLPCQLSDIVRIEVLEGPAGRVYGTSSLVGAINIVTETRTTAGVGAGPVPARNAGEPPALPVVGNASERSVEVGAAPVPARSFTGEATLEGGSFGYAKAAFAFGFSGTGHHSSPSVSYAATSWQPSSFTHRLSASYQRSDGYSRSRAGHLNTDYSGTKLFYQGTYERHASRAGTEPAPTSGSAGGSPASKAGTGSTPTLSASPLRLSWHAGLSDRGWGSGTFYATPRWNADEQYEHTRKLFADVQADAQAGGLHLQPALYWQQHRDRYEGYRDRPDLMAFNYNRCNVYGLKLNAYFDSPIGRTAIGAELRNEDLKSSNLGEPLNAATSANGESATMGAEESTGTDTYSGRYTRGVNRTNISAHLEHNVVLRRLTVSAGFVATKNSWVKEEMTLYPGIDVSYRLVDNALKGRQLKLFAGWNTSLRLPSFTEMYYRLQGYAADPHLKPEKMQAMELGAQLATPRLLAKATVFHHRGRNMIDWIMDTSLGDAAVWQSVNHTRINSTGFETSMTISIPSFFVRSSRSSRGNQLPSHRRGGAGGGVLSLSYSYMNQDKSLEEHIVSQYALEYLRHKLVVTLQQPLWRQLRGRIGLRWQDRVGTYTNFEGEACDYRPYALMDARLTWTDRRYRIYAEVNNLLDNRSYVDFGNVAQPGIWFVVGTTVGL